MSGMGPEFEKELPPNSRCTSSSFGRDVLKFRRVSRAHSSRGTLLRPFVLANCPAFQSATTISARSPSRAREKGSENESIVNRAPGFCSLLAKFSAREIKRRITTFAVFVFFFRLPAPVIIPLFQNCYNPRPGCIIFRALTMENSRASPAVYYSLANTVRDIHE